MSTNEARVRNGSKRRRPSALEVLTLAVAVAVSLIAVELGLRVADRLGWTAIWANLREARTASIWIPSENPDLIYRHRPGYIKEGTRYTDRHGILRETDAAQTPDADTTRIVLIGDSVAASIYLPYEQRFSALLEGALSARDESRRPFEVLNFSTNGYSATQEATLLEVSAGDFNPDLLMVQFCMNDFRPTRFPTRWFEPHPSSYILTAAKYLFDRRLLDGYPDAAYWEREFQTDQAGWDLLSDGFDRIRRYAEARDVPVFLVIFPLLSQEGWYEGAATQRHSQVRELALSHDFEVFDLLPRLAESQVDSLQVNPWDTYHLNAEGHQIAAEAIADAIWELDPQWRLPRH